MMTAALSLIFGAASLLGFDQKHRALSALLQDEVVTSGVKYSSLKTRHGALQNYLQELAAVKEAEFKTWAVGDRLAFLINLYNATTLDQVLQHYPIQSFKSEVGGKEGPWKIPVVQVFGKSLSLDELEHRLIRGQFNEPRIHFALNCASEGCPPLRSEAYRGEDLSRQLGEQTVLFLSNARANVVTKDRIVLSPIFDWFREDFVKRSGSVKAFLNPYYKNLDLTKSGAKITYSEYGWGLNEAK